MQDLWVVYIVDLQTREVYLIEQEVPRKLAVGVVAKWDAKEKQCIPIAWPKWAGEPRIAI